MGVLGERSFPSDRLGCLPSSLDQGWVNPNPGPRWASIDPRQCRLRPQLDTGMRPRQSLTGEPSGAGRGWTPPITGDVAIVEARSDSGRPSAPVRDESRDRRRTCTLERTVGSRPIADRDRPWCDCPEKRHCHDHPHTRRRIPVPGGCRSCCCGITSCVCGTTGRASDPGAGYVRSHVGRRDLQSPFDQGVPVGPCGCSCRPGCCWA